MTLENNKLSPSSSDKEFETNALDIDEFSFRSTDSKSYFHMKKYSSDVQGLKPMSTQKVKSVIYDP